MITTKRIIPCLDVKDGSVVKGVQFKELKKTGDPVQIAQFYSESGADELVILDISATLEERKTFVHLIEKIAEKVFIPLTVGGGISDNQTIKQLLNAGADKVSINSAAIKNPELIQSASNEFGSQCIVVAIDVKKTGNHWEIYTHSGTKSTGLDAVEWSKKVVQLGGGEILLTSMDCDGIQKGYDLAINDLIAQNVDVPVIASGGAGSLDDMVEVLKKTQVSAVLAASIFHFGTHTIQEAKTYFKQQDILVREQN